MELHVTIPFPTTYGRGPFHPAIRNVDGLWYWPDITYDTEDEAYKWAKLTLEAALEKAREHARGWNILKV